MFCFKVKFAKSIWNFHWSKILLQRYGFLAIFHFGLTNTTSTVGKLLCRNFCKMSPFWFSNTVLLVCFQIGETETRKSYKCMYFRGGRSINVIHIVVVWRAIGLNSGYVVVQFFWFWYHALVLIIFLRYVKLGYDYTFCIGCIRWCT